jgi:hypothetical protein
MAIVVIGYCIRQSQLTTDLPDYRARSTVLILLFKGLHDRQGNIIITFYIFTVSTMSFISLQISTAIPEMCPSKWEKKGAISYSKLREIWRMVNDCMLFWN